MGIVEGVKIARRYGDENPALHPCRINRIAVLAGCPGMADHSNLLDNRYFVLGV